MCSSRCIRGGTIHAQALKSDRNVVEKKHPFSLKWKFRIIRERFKYSSQGCQTTVTDLESRGAASMKSCLLGLGSSNALVSRSSFQLGKERH